MGVEFKDTRVEQSDWPPLKGDSNSIPAQMFGSMPVIAFGKYQLAQSIATAQFAFDLAVTKTGGSRSAQQRALDMMMLGAHADLQSAMYACLFGSDEAKATGKEALAGKVTPILQGIERQYKGDGPFLYNTLEGGPTLGDLAVFNV